MVHFALNVVNLNLHLQRVSHPVTDYDMSGAQEVFLPRKDRGEFASTLWVANGSHAWDDARRLSVVWPKS